jgi:DNA invertase Pin-like site-specific DNA recombinase
MYKQLERYRKANGRVRIVKYGRCSSDEQGKNGYTIADQLDYIEIFAKENDLIIIDEYVDEGISATLEINKRPALAQLIKDAKAGKFDIVVFKCLDRFFRNVGEYYEAQKQLKKAGVTWLSIEEADLDPEDVDAAFKINIYLSMAEYEARKTSKRILFNNKMRIKNKQVVAGSHCFLFPWKVVGEKKNKHLVRDMEQADRLYDLLDHFEMFQSKNATLQYNNSKYAPMMWNTICNLLTDTLLYGEYKGVPDYVEPYITKERFDRIQDILKRNTTHFEATGRVYIFSGLMKCRCCGSSLVGNHYKAKSTGKSTFSYRCNKNEKNKSCTNNHSLSERKIEQQLLDNLEQYVANEIVRVQAISEKAKPEIIDNTKKIEELKKEMARLNKMFRKGNIEEDEYDKEIADIKSKLKKLEAIEQPQERDLTALKQLVESDYRTIYEALDRPHRKAFWRKIIKQFSINEQRKIDPDSIIFF